MPRANSGEVWLVDLGLVAKVRPCLILSRFPEDDELALIVIIPHTTAVRGNRWEFRTELSFLEKGAFHIQQIQPVSLPKLLRRLGFLPQPVFALLKRQMVAELELQ